MIGPKTDNSPSWRAFTKNPLPNAPKKPTTTTYPQKPGWTLWKPYKNKNGHLPTASGREWIEADLNYKFGFRNDQRILFSNDGLIFVTYDHYKTFCEII